METPHQVGKASSNHEYIIQMSFSVANKNDARGHDGDVCCDDSSDQMPTQLIFTTTMSLTASPAETNAAPPDLRVAHDQTR